MIVCDETVNATIETIDYRVLNDQVGRAWVQFPFLADTQQRFFFDFSLADVNAIVVANDSLHFNLSTPLVSGQPNELFNILISDPYYSASHYENQTANLTYLPKNAFYTFQGGVEIKVLDANLGVTH